VKVFIDKCDELPLSYSMNELDSGDRDRLERQNIPREAICNGTAK